MSENIEMRNGEAKHHLNNAFLGPMQWSFLDMYVKDQVPRETKKLMA